MSLPRRIVEKMALLGGRPTPGPWLRLGGLVLALVASGTRHAPAQVLPGMPMPGSRYELSGTVEVDRAGREALALLDRAKALLADRQWGEAIDTLVRVMEGHGHKLVGVTERRFVSVRDYCHLQLASLPPEALKLYRDRVDPQAKRLFEDGVSRRAARPLLDLLDRAFASSWGDNALNALGEMALESGDYASARAYWEKIIPVPPPAGAPSTWLSVPDTELDLAGIRARLVLVSILEGSLGRARDELAQLVRLHPNARGRFGGRTGEYAAVLSAMLAESAAWPKRRAAPDWPTFAGSPLRNGVGPTAPDVGSPVWQVSLRRFLVSLKPAWGDSAPAARVAEDPKSPLSYHPIVLGNLVLVNNLSEILAFDLATGKPAWGHDRSLIYADALDEDARQSYVPPGSLGLPRFTMTAYGGRLYARMGPAVTVRPQESRGVFGSGYLVCLDLSAEGRLAWKISPPEGMAFEGAPLSDGTSVYVAMRRSEVQPQVHVACYDAQTGQPRWRQFVCAAEVPARGAAAEISHNLLTLRRDTLYCNSSCGAVAALAARDGRPLWVTLYPRALSGDLAKPPPHANRDLTPCLYDRGTLLVAPADSPRLFAVDAATGMILWQTGPELEDVVHLLGVAHDTLIASGHKLVWISMKPGEQGKVRHRWPDGSEKLGYGRGVLCGDCVLWPTRERIYVFDPATGQLKKDVPLVPRGITGGNLVVAGGRVLVAGEGTLVALGEASVKPPGAAKPQAAAHVLSP